MIAYVARGIAAVAAGLGLAAIWIDFGGGSSYWDSSSHGVGIAMLVLGILALLGVLLAFALRHPALDGTWITAGLPLGGLLMLIPVEVFGQGSVDELDSGGWLGVASFGLFVVAALLASVLGAAFVRTATAGPVAPAGRPPVQSQAAPAPAAGWYPDPSGQGGERYWDGSTWSDQTR